MPSVEKHSLPATQDKGSTSFGESVLLALMLGWLVIPAFVFVIQGIQNSGSQEGNTGPILSHNENRLHRITEKNEPLP